ncbi:MAG: hypothetical protein OXB88_11120, partial [Bacteriovoracales bacterium]|nr:hypothetical protein [Bacteriovoracales bacterium]
MEKALLLCIMSTESGHLRSFPIENPSSNVFDLQPEEEPDQIVFLLSKKVTARTSSKNCNKGKVTVLHPDKIGRRQRGATEACFLHVAGKRRGS